jgi:hypothetical protein
VSDNWVLRRIFGPKREEAVEGRIRMHNEELHNLYASSNIIMVIKRRRLRGAGNVARVGDVINAYTVLVGKLE